MSKSTDTTDSPGAALARKRWAKTTPEERSALMADLARKRAKKLGKRGMRALSAKGGRAGKGTKKPGSGRKPAS